LSKLLSWCAVSGTGADGGLEKGDNAEDQRQSGDEGQAARVAESWGGERVGGASGEGEGEGGQQQQEGPSSPAASASRNGNDDGGRREGEHATRHDSQPPRRDPMEELEEEEEEVGVLLMTNLVLITASLILSISTS